MEWLTYLSKVSACTALFYAFYHFFLQKLTFFSINRGYLLSTLLLSFLIPLMHLEMERPAPELPENASVKLPAEIIPGPGATTENFGAAIPAIQTIQVSPVAAKTGWQQFLPLVYWLVAGTGLILFFYQLAVLAWYSRRVSGRAGFLKLVDKAGGFTDCSFFNYVFINRNKSQDALQTMLQHERIHALKLHSLDKMLVSLGKSILWFNPFIYLYSRALEQVHEYEADKETSCIVGNAVYANLLLSLAVSTKTIPLAHSFVKNPVKERIKMLFTNPSKNMKKLMYLSLVPAGLALVWLFGVQVVYAESKTKIENDVTVAPNRATPNPAEKAANPEPSLTKNKKTDINQPSFQGTEPEAPLRLIDNMALGDNPAVFIDGKEYPAEILTRISPSCMKSAVMSLNKAEITTRNNQIEYATKAEVETAKIRRKIKAQARFYNRYAVTINGHKQDEVMIRLGSGFTQTSFPKDYRVVLSIDGKVFSEEEAMRLKGNYAYNMTLVVFGYTKDEPELLSKYGDRYDLVLQFSKGKADSAAQIPEVYRGSSANISEGYYGRFEYAAKDSLTYSKEKRYVTLYGKASIINGQRFSLHADRIRFDAKTRMATAQNATFTYKGKKKSFEGALLKVDIDKGTYEVLSGTPDF